MLGSVQRRKEGFVYYISGFRFLLFLFGGIFFPLLTAPVPGAFSFWGFPKKKKKKKELFKRRESR